MAHKLPRLSKSLLEKPQLVHPTKMEEIAEVLTNRPDYLQTNKDLFFFDMDEEDELEVDDEYGDPTLGVLRVEGPTTYKPSGWEALCGGTSYVGLVDQMKSFASEGKKKVLMKLDSPGGQAYRMVWAAKEIRKIADDNGMKITAYVDGMAASAGMGLASAAHEIVVNPDGEMGSIGVVIGLIDRSKMDEADGIRRIYVTAGEKKRPFAEDGSFKDSFLADLQEDCDALYEKFSTLVADMRGISVEAVKATQADMFRADEAVEIGLADKVMEEPEFLEYLLGRAPADDVDNSEGWDREPYEPEASASNSNKSKVNTDMSTPEMSAEMAAQFEQMKAQLEALTAKSQADAEALASYKAKEEAAAKAELSGMLDGFEFAAAHKEALMGFMFAGGDGAKLMGAVLESAQSSITSKVAEAEQASAAAIQEANEKAEAAEAEAKATKESFGKPQAIESEVEGKTTPTNAETGPARTADLQAFVSSLNSK